MHWPQTDTHAHTHSDTHTLLAASLKLFRDNRALSQCISWLSAKRKGHFPGILLLPCPWNTLLQTHIHSCTIRSQTLPGGNKIIWFHFTNEPYAVINETVLSADNEPVRVLCSLAAACVLIWSKVVFLLRKASHQLTVHRKFGRTQTTVVYYDVNEKLCKNILIHVFFFYFSRLRYICACLLLCGDHISFYNWINSLSTG